MTMRSLAVVAVMSCLATVSLPAVAGDGGASLTLAAPAPKADYIIDGSHWICSANACEAGAVDAMPALRSCKHVVAQVGAVTAFTWRGKSLSDADLAVCNAAARK